MKTSALAIAIILILAAFFRFYLITEIPPGLYPDEAANGNNAVEALDTGGFRIFYSENNGREGLFINLQALAIRVFGAEPWALRMVSAIFGTLTVLGIYLLAKELFRSSESRIRNHESRDMPHQDSRFKIQDSTLVALLSAFLLATSYWHINFSRIGFRAIMVPFFAVFGMYWLLKVLRTGKISSAVLAGIATGLGFYTYIAFRFMPFVFAVPIFFALSKWRRENQELGIRNQELTSNPNSSFMIPDSKPCVLCIVSFFLLITFVVALPIGLYFLNNHQDFFGRGGQVSIFSAESPAYEFAKSTVLTLGMFNFLGDCNQRHNLECAPQLFWPVGLLFIVGLWITIRNLFRKPLSPIPYTLSAWFVFLMLPATLTREGLPHALRTIGLIAPVMILAGFGGIWFWQKILSYFDRALKNSIYAKSQNQIRRIRKELFIVALLLLLWLPITAYRDYFFRFAYSKQTADAFAEDLWHKGRYLDGLSAQTMKIVIVNMSGDDIRGVPAPAQTIMFATDTFDETKRKEKKFIYIRDLQSLPPIAGGKTIILPMNSRDPELIRALVAHYPSAKAKTLEDFLIFEVRN